MGVFLGALFVNGCSFLNMAKGPGDLDALARSKNEVQESLRRYIGVTSDQLRAELGQPRYVEFNVKYNVEFDAVNKKWLKDTADEQWIYEKVNGIKYLYGSIQWCVFYIKDNHVVAVE